jgi:hypothetical protein
MCAHDLEADTMDDPTRSSTDGHDNGKNGAQDAPDTMFDSLKVAAGDIAEKAGPTVRDLSARAADLTATAADKAAPLVRRAGAATADASLRLAEAARSWAADLRGDRTATATAETSSAETSSAPSATAVAEPPASHEQPEDLAPADFAAEEPQAVSDPAPFEYSEEPASPAFEEGSGAGDQDAPRPGI